MDMPTFPSDDTVNSVVLGATLYDAQDKIVMKQDDVNVMLTFAYEYNGRDYDLSGWVSFQPFSSRNQNVFSHADRKCGFWDVRSSAWSTKGCHLTTSDAYSSQCECNHLTNFGVLLDINGNLQGEVSFTDHGTVNGSVTVLTLSCLFLCSRSVELPFKVAHAVTIFIDDAKHQSAQESAGHLNKLRNLVTPHSGAYLEYDFIHNLDSGLVCFPSS